MEERVGGARRQYQHGDNGAGHHRLRRGGALREPEPQRLDLLLDDRGARLRVRRRRLGVELPLRQLLQRLVLRLLPSRARRRRVVPLPLREEPGAERVEHELALLGASRGLGGLDLAEAVRQRCPLRRELPLQAGPRVLA